MGSPRDVNGTDISRSYSNLIRSGRVFIRNRSVSNAQKLHFYDVDIHYNLIRQKLTLFVSDSVFEHKYENKYDISNIRLYPIRLYPYLGLYETG